jgi:hypothetical protein
VLPVRQASALLTASFRFALASDTLAVRLMFPLTGHIGDFHSQECAPCRAHIKKPFLVYTGSKDGNVVVQIRKQKQKILNSGGIVEILNGTDHFGLVNNHSEIEKRVFPKILSTASAEK